LFYRSVGVFFFAESPIPQEEDIQVLIPSFGRIQRFKTIQPASTTINISTSVDIFSLLPLVEDWVGVAATQFKMRLESVSGCSRQPAGIDQAQLNLLELGPQAELDRPDPADAGEVEKGDNIRPNSLHPHLGQQTACSSRCDQMRASKSWQHCLH